MSERKRINIDVDPRIADVLSRLAAEANVTEGELIDRIVAAHELKQVLARTRAASDLDEEQAMALAREELEAVRKARRAA